MTTFSTDSTYVHRTDPGSNSNVGSEMAPGSQQGQHRDRRKEVQGGQRSLRGPFRRRKSTTLRKVSAGQFQNSWLISLCFISVQNKRTVYDQYGEEGLKANGGAGPGASPFGPGTGGGAFPGASFGFGGGGGGFQASDPNDIFS